MEKGEHHIRGVPQRVGRFQDGGKYRRRIAKKELWWKGSQGGRESEKSEGERQMPEIIADKLVTGR